MDIYKGILRSSTDLLRTYNREELNQFLRRYLIEGLHLRTFTVERILGEEHIIKRRLEKYPMKGSFSSKD